MKVNQLLSPLCIVLCFGCLGARNYDSPYCDIRPCYSMNLPCNNSGTMLECPDSSKLLKERDFREDLEETFNTLRNDVAGGKIYRNLPPAARMGKMSWNNELAQFARLDVKRCRVAPRPWICSQKFYAIGRLAELYGFQTDNLTSTTFETLQSMASGWMSRVSSITRYQSLHLPTKYEESINILQSALLLIEHNTQFGCAVLHYTSNLYTYLMLSCVFGADTQDGQRMYNWGIRPGIKCRHLDSTYQNLCSSEEKYSYEHLYRKMDSVRMSKTW
ncbi:tabinhibitin 6 [Drosophila virilis]|nr:allergen Tab y 5.0101 [Drosophila virilis]